MNKRANGEGTFRIRDNGTWECMIRHNGKRHSIYGKSRKECITKLKDLRKQLDFGIAEKSKSITYKTLLENYLENIIAIKNRPSTYDNYKSVIDNHLIPYLGKYKVDKLTRTDIQDMIKKEKKAGKSASTIGLIHHVCRTSLAYAIELKIIMDNPSLGVVKPQAEKKEMHVLTEDQFRHLRDIGGDIRSKERMFSCFIFMFYTGLRRGEVLGLKWSDVDMTEKSLSMKRAVTKSTSKGVIITKGKTARAVRSIPLPANAIKELLIFKETQAEEKTFYGKKYNNENWIFCRPDGKRYYPTSLRKIFLRILALADIPAIRVHDTRHTFATFLMLAGENPKTVQAIMGHANIATTLGYSHVTDGLKRQAADKLDNI